MSKPTNISTLLTKLKGESVISNGGVSDLDKINAICDIFIMNLKGAGVDIKDYNVSVSLDTNVISKSSTDEDIETVEKEIEEPEPELCPVCMDDIDEMSDTLLCGHKVHHECIFEWYKDLNDGGGCEGNKIPRTCPYCRQDGGYLTMYSGEAYIAGVHDVKFKNGIPIEPKKDEDTGEKAVKASVDTVVLTTPTKVSVAVAPPPAPIKPTKKGSAKKSPKMAKNMWQCHGFTKKGKQCKKSKISGTNFCYIHLPDYSTTKKS